MSEYGKHHQNLSFEEYKEKVMDGVWKLNEGEPWFSGCCTDTIQDSYNEGYSVERAIELADMDTQYWDFPWWVPQKDGE